MKIKLITYVNGTVIPKRESDVVKTLYLTILYKHTKPSTSAMPGTIGYITLNGLSRFGSFLRKIKRDTILMQYITTAPNTDKIMSEFANVADPAQMTAMIPGTSRLQTALLFYLLWLSPLENSLLSPMRRFGVNIPW
jgi:hypothetical protein